MSLRPSQPGTDIRLTWISKPVNDEGKKIRLNIQIHHSRIVITIVAGLMIWIRKSFDLLDATTNVCMGQVLGGKIKKGWSWSLIYICGHLWKIRIRHPYLRAWCPSRLPEPCTTVVGIPSKPDEPSPLTRHCQVLRYPIICLRRTRVTW